MSTPSNMAPRTAVAEKPLIPETVKTVLIVVLLIGVAYLLYANYQNQQNATTQFAKVGEQIKALENADRAVEEKINTNVTTLSGKIAETQDAVGSTKTEIQKTAQQVRAEGQRTKSELTQEIAKKADTTQVQEQVQAAKTEADTKIGQVTNDVGGVKKDVTGVRTDLGTTQKNLEGTQRQLIDFRDTLNSAIAKNAAELAELRRKGERDYFEFEIPKKNQNTKVQDIALVLTKTDPKKGKFTIRILADDAQLEKKDRTVNEPVQFLVGQNHLRYEVVVNWVQKDKVGGYISVPKDKALSAEHVSAK